MAATAWALYNQAKHHLGNGVIKLGVDAFRMKLCQPASNANTPTLSTFQSANLECAGGGYPANGKAIGSPTWGAGSSAGQRKFTGNAVVFSANGSTLLNVSYGVIGNSANGKLLCWSRLSTASFNVTSPNTLTVTPHSKGIFTMT
jgi:hypothetical protein